MLVVACLAVLVAGACSGSDDPEGRQADDDSGWPGAGPAPQALVGVLQQEPIAESPPEDLYLVELGAPLEDGTLVVERAHLSEIRTASVTANPSASGDPPPEEGIVTLPDERYLVGWGRTGRDDEYFDETGAVVVDTATGAVDEVFRIDEAAELGGSATWDVDRLMLRVDPGRCFAWDEATPGSGFTEGECPAFDPLPDGADELDDWDYTCCSPFEITDPDSGEVVFEDDTIPEASRADLGQWLPQFLDQDDGTLLFTVPTPIGLRLLVLSPDGTVAEVGTWSWEDARDAVDVAATLVDGAVVYSERVFERPDSASRLTRYTIGSGDAEVLVEGGLLRWAVVSAEVPWLAVWQEPDQVDEEMVTTVWTGPAASGPLEAVGELDHASLPYGDPWVDPSTGTVLFTTDRVLTVAGSERQATRLWRLEEGVAPVEVQRGAQIQVLATTDEGRSVLLTSLDEDCRRSGPGCRQALRLVTPDDTSELVTNIGQVWFLDDGATLAFDRSVRADYATPYESEVGALTLDHPDEARIWYGPGSSPTVPDGAGLAALVGASTAGNLDFLPLCVDSCEAERLPQPRDLFACTFFPEELGC